MRPHVGISRVLAFPGALPVDPGRELAAGPILEIRPDDGGPWIAVFDGGDYESPPAAPTHVLGWPDERSVCVVDRGWGCVVRADDPDVTFEIDCYPICDVLVAPDHGLVVFADFTDVVAYGRDGVMWRCPDVVTDELRIVALDGDALHVSGFDAASYPEEPYPEIAVDVRTGR
jgi:hypothetical protein